MSSKWLNSNGEVLYKGTVECGKTTELSSFGKLYEVRGKWEKEMRYVALGVQKGTVKQLQVTGFGTVVNNVSELRTAKEHTNIHINPLNTKRRLL